MSLNTNLVAYGTKPRSLIGVGGHFVKSHLIDILGLQKGKNCLMIDGGQAGDLGKYVALGIRDVIITDPFADQLERAKKSILYSRVKVSTRVLAFNSPKYIRIINNKFDVIDWQLAIHYTWSIQYSDELAAKLRLLIRDNGKIVISCFDGSLLRKELSIHKQLVFRLTEDKSFKFTYKDEYSYIFEGGEFTVTENYVFLDTLTQSLKLHNIKLDSRISFSETLKLKLHEDCDTANCNNKGYVIGKSELLSQENTPLFSEMIKYYSFLVGLIYSADITQQ